MKEAIKILERNGYRVEVKKLRFETVVFVTTDTEIIAHISERLFKINTSRYFNQEEMIAITTIMQELSRNA